MFNLKRAKAQFVSQFTPTVTVKMIHNEFDTAVDRLINEAIGLRDSDKEKHDKLKKLGFGRSKHVIDVSILVTRTEKQKNISEYVNMYKRRYPFNKFITNDLVESICAKYGLVFGRATDYLGDIQKKILQKSRTLSSWKKIIRK